MVTVNSTLDVAMQLDFISREILLDLLQKRQAEERRSLIAKEAKQSLKSYRLGKLKPINANEAIQYLNKL